MYVGHSTLTKTGFGHKPVQLEQFLQVNWSRPQYPKFMKAITVHQRLCTAISRLTKSAVQYPLLQQRLFLVIKKSPWCFSEP